MTPRQPGPDDIAAGKRRLSVTKGARMSCEEAWNRVRELGGQSANAHQAYAALVGPPAFMKVLSAKPAMSLAITEARERCNHADEVLDSAMQAAIKAHHYSHPISN